MGNKKNTLTWQWPLISLEWLPEIISSLDSLLEPSWVGLQREMTANINNQSFGRRIFAQLQQLLIETELIQEEGRFFYAQTKPIRGDISAHLRTFFENSSEPWAIFFRKISSEKIPITFTNQNTIIAREWKDLSKYSIFKQWAEFFQFTGLGFFIEGETFIPESAFTPNMFEDKLFVEKCIRTNRDPRLLSGHYSLHTEGDFLAWTKGEDNLPISTDPYLVPRIPHEVIAKHSNDSTEAKISEAISYWKQQIEETAQETITSNLEQLIITHKIFIDYFLFGSRAYDLDFLSREKLLTIKSIWASVPNFYLNANTWKAIPRLYNNITRLSFSILYYRNSLQRVINPWDLYNEELLTTRVTDTIKKLPIRAFRSKRHLSNFLEAIFTINTSISRLIETGTNEKYRNNVSVSYAEAVNFLPKDVIESQSTLDDAAQLIVIEHEEISNLKHDLPLNLLADCPHHPKLATCYWIHKENEIAEHPKAQTVRAIKKKLCNLEEKLRIDMTHFEQDMVNWDEAYTDLKKIIMTFTPTQ